MLFHHVVMWNTRLTWGESMEVQNRQKMNTGGQKQRDRWKSHKQTPLWLSILRKLAALWTLSTHTHTNQYLRMDVHAAAAAAAGRFATRL